MKTIKSEILKSTEAINKQLNDVLINKYIRFLVIKEVQDKIGGD